MTGSAHVLEHGHPAYRKPGTNGHQDHPDVITKQSKVFTIRFTTEESHRVKDAVFKFFVLAKRTEPRASQISLNEFCRQAIFRACDHIEAKSKEEPNLLRT